jgi:hypothetical protein
MKINYPVKYAAMPIIEQVGFSHGVNELKRKYDIVCYIVSKCYLLNNSTKYKEDGHGYKEYEVVFPYQIGEFKNWNRTIPNFNLINGICINSNIVDFVSNSYEEVLQYTEIKNEELCRKSCITLPYTNDIAKKFQEKKDEFYNRLSKYKMLEQQILLNTDDLEIEKRKDLNRVLRFKNNKLNILSCNLYEVIQLYDDTKFVVYTLTQEQYDKLLKLTSELEISNIESIIGNTEGLLVHKSNDSIMRIVNPNIDGVYYIDEDKQLHYSDKFNKVTKDEFENIDEDTHIFYTTENTFDLMNSYKRYEEIDLSKVQGPVLKKKI